MVRSNSNMLDAAAGILTPRLVDNRLTGLERTQVEGAMTVIAQWRGLLGLGQTWLQIQRQDAHDQLAAQAIIIASIDEANPGQFSVWELYNAADLLDFVMENALSGAESSDPGY